MPTVKCNCHENTKTADRLYRNDERISTGHMSAEDMAKVGLLCLNKGRYGDKQIVSAEWIEEMTRPRTVENDNFRGMDYGYLWWIIDREKNIYAAIGNSGNVIYVNPEKDVVVAVASYFKPTVFDRVDFIRKYIEPLEE